MPRKKTVRADERANLLDHPHIKNKLDRLYAEWEKRERTGWKPVWVGAEKKARKKHLPALPSLSPDKLAFLKKLADTTVDPSLDPKRDLPYSRKTGQITIKDPLNRFESFEVLPKKVDDEIERLTRIADGTGPKQRLLDGLRAARIKHGKLIEGKKKTRGKHAKTENKTLAYDNLRSKLRWAGAWTYCFVRMQWKYPREKRYPPVQQAEDEVKPHVAEWEKHDHPYQIRLITAHLLGKAYKTEREKNGLLDPLAKYENFNSESFYLTYIQPELHWVRKRITKSPRLADFFRIERRKGRVPVPPVSFLRDVFHPFLR